MSRSVLPENRIHAAIRDKISQHQRAVVDEVQAMVARHPVVVVGMGINPFPRRARAALDRAGIGYQYLEYGSYLGQWRKRNALKLWTGWPTFPMVFVQGMLVGGASDLQRLLDSGELQAMLAAPRPD